MTHNYPGLTDTLQRLGINEVSEVNTILRLSDYGKKETNDVAADSQHLLEWHRGKRKISDSGTEQGEKKIAGSMSPRFVVDKKASIQAFTQEGIRWNKEVKSVLNKLKHSAFKA